MYLHETFTSTLLILVVHVRSQELLRIVQFCADLWTNCWCSPTVHCVYQYARDPELLDIYQARVNASAPAALRIRLRLRLLIKKYGTGSDPQKNNRVQIRLLQLIFFSLAILIKKRKLKHLTYTYFNKTLVLKFYWTASVIGSGSDRLFGSGSANLIFTHWKCWHFQHYACART